MGNNRKHKLASRKADRVADPVVCLARKLAIEPRCELGSDHGLRVVPHAGEPAHELSLRYWAVAVGRLLTRLTGARVKQWVEQSHRGLVKCGIVLGVGCAFG